MVFTLFRIILLFTEFKQLEILPHKYALIANAFFMGWRFDTVISGYILFFPLLFLSIFSFFNGSKKLLYNIIHYFIFIFFSLAFALCALDIPYFNYYFSRLTIVILSWTDNAAFGFKMIFEETSYFIYFIVFLIVCFLFYISIKKIKKIIVSNSSSIGNKKINFYISHLLFSLLALAIMFLGIRGRIEKKSPIKVGTAYFSNYAFPNQLGLNPVFTFIQSYIDKLNPENASLHLMDNGLAIKITNTNLGIKNNQIPFERLVEAKSNQPNANIVLVIMESMSAGKMKRFGNTKNLTPFLDSIANVGLCFNNIYSAGIHTFNGIFSTLFSYPALLKQHPMNATEIPIYTGFSNTLKNFGYQNIYFTTHDEQFDNVSGFLHANGFDKIVSQKDYPSSAILSTLGVPDHYMFNFSIPLLNQLNNNKKAFFAAFMTASDHGPYIIPDNIPFKPKQNDMREGIVEYADWAISQFVTDVSNQKWFDNTIFVFLADHGSVIGSNIYDMPLTYNHIPLIVYAPKLIKESKSIDEFGGQIDVYPTIMGLLGYSYVNNTAGIDLLNEKRPYMYFSADDKIGCVNDSLFYIYRTNGKESLFKYKKEETKDYIADYKHIAIEMRNYAFANFQASQWMISNKKTK
jgi:phosphoglycerol transferase MdoB-like AlkP superfamily enzyme